MRPNRTGFVVPHVVVVVVVVVVATTPYTHGVKTWQAHVGAGCYKRTPRLARVLRVTVLVRP